MPRLITPDSVSVDVNLASSQTRGRVGAVVAKAPAQPEPLPEADMAEITGEVIIGRPAEAVFDFVADQRNEPR